MSGSDGPEPELNLVVGIALNREGTLIAVRGFDPAAHVHTATRHIATLGGL